MRGDKIHEHQDKIEDNHAKKREIDDEGRYEVVKQVVRTERSKKED